MRSARSVATIRILALLTLAALLTACLGDQVKRVSPPAVGIQQLSVGADGRWQVQVRLNNYSNVPMRFTALHLQLEVQGIAAGTLDATPNLDIGPASADVANVTLVPGVEARIAIATALASGQGVAYRLEGHVTANADGKRSHDYPLRAESRLNPAPGLPGVLR
jgi:hypothetical protein